MYYKYETVVEVTDENDSDFVYGVKLKENIYFQIADCYCKIIKNHDYSFEISDQIMMCCFLSEDKPEEAKKLIKQAIEWFSFLTFIPYDAANIVIQTSEADDVPSSPVGINKNKINKINELNECYKKIHKKQALLLKVLQLNNAGLKISEMMGINEDSFFSYFKIVENIVKDEFAIEKNTIPSANDKIKQCVEKVFNEIYKVKLSESKIQDITGNVSDFLFETTFDGIHAKISWYLNRNNIILDKESLRRIINIRNSIAHGDVVDNQELINLYNKIYTVSRKCIECKFFKQIKNVEIPSYIKVFKPEIGKYVILAC